MTTAAEQIQQEHDARERKAREHQEQKQAQEPVPPGEGEAAVKRREEQEAQRVEAAKKLADVPAGAVPLATPQDRQTAADRDREAATQAAIEHGKQSQAMHDQHQAELRGSTAEGERVDPIEALCQAIESLPMSIGPGVRALVAAARKGGGTEPPAARKAKE